jgi:hypothetical protein
LTLFKQTSRSLQQMEQALIDDLRVEVGVIAAR